MIVTDILFLIVCGIGSLNGLFLAGHIAVRRKKQASLNWLIAALVLTFSIRVSKAVWVFFISETHPFFELLWMVLFVSAGFIFLKYVWELTGAAGAHARRLLDVGAATAGLVGLVYLFRDSIFLALVVALGVPIASGTLAASRFRHRATGAEDLASRWLVAVALFMMTIWATYAAFVTIRTRLPLDEAVAFNAEAVLVSLALYALLFVELRHGLIARVHQSRQKNTAGVDAGAQRRLEQLMEEQQVYLDPSLTLPSLAKMLKLSPQHLSRILNANLGVGFNDYINRFRIQEACRLLAKPDASGKKVGSMAFECGFNSSSVFYAAFKKFTGKTPTEYLDERVHV